MQSAFHFIPKMSSGDDIKPLCHPHDFFKSSLGKPCLHGPCFVDKGIVMLGQVWKTYSLEEHHNVRADKTIRQICAFNFVAQFGKEPRRV